MRSCNHSAYAVWWPNIQGTINYLRSYRGDVKDDPGSGAFKWQSTGENPTATMFQNYGLAYLFDPVFKASNGSAIYSGTKVQQNALSVLACIRT